VADASAFRSELLEIAAGAGAGPGRTWPEPDEDIEEGWTTLARLKQEGKDVPYAFDGAVSATISEGPTTVGFEIVRHQAKLEAPLRSLANFGGRLFISTLADITFYGSDLAGNEIQVTGTISVSFSDYADPE